MIDTPSSCPFQNQRHASRKKTIFTYESTIFRHLIHDANLFMEISTHHKVQQMIYPTERTVRWPSKHQHHCRLCMLSTFAGNFIALEHKLTTITKTILLAKKKTCRLITIACETLPLLIQSRHSNHASAHVGGFHPALLKIPYCQKITSFYELANKS